ncbi:hypothetical protein GY45DRAFT_1395406 [Cubamyces sp. BRFM 1775]|nr:hypothetical protein GY45DRAFT_1395406 [Cubamyces sp. BRFM 1775]
MSFYDFMDAFSWGDRDCTVNPSIKVTRRKFLQHEGLTALLERWRKPPRPRGSTKPRSEGGRKALEQFALDCTTDVIREELTVMDAYFRPSEAEIRREDLTNLNLDSLKHELRVHAPVLVNLLEQLMTAADPRYRTIGKAKETQIIIIIGIILYTRSNRCNLLQRVLGIYFKFKGLSAKACDTLHALGVTMSSKWITDAVDGLSKESMLTVQRLFPVIPSFLCWDNVYITFRVFSPRIDKEGQTGCGTASMIFFKRDAPLEPLMMNSELQRQRTAGMSNPLTVLDIYDLAADGYPHIEAWMTHHVLEVLRDAPEFSFATYSGRDHSALDPPPPVKLVPCGADHVTEPYFLGTLSTPEASYEDNDKVLHDLLHQLGVHTQQQWRDLGTKRVLVLVGDQLTVDRIRGLQRFRGQDLNATDRMDYIIPVWGWLHYEMAIAKSLHKQYFGTASGLGFKHAFALLERRGLDETATQGPFHDNFERAIYDTLTARIRASWLEVGGVESLAELRSNPPEVLARLAARIVHEHASVRRLNVLKDMGTDCDQVLYHAVMFNRDLLLYVVLNQAIKRGDVGLMEHMLPHMLFRFVGGRNSHYAGETLEMLQGLHREWPSAISNFIRYHCWLVNRTGKRDGHTPVDRAMEAGIKTIKARPHIDWAYLHKLHPAISTIEAVSDHVEHVFCTWTRYGRHSTPDDEKGIEILQRAYTSSKIYQKRRGRSAASTEDIPQDFISEGGKKLSRVMQRWIDGRTFDRRHSNVYPS